MRAGVVLSGGQSRRMGQDKSQLIWQGQSLLDRQLDMLSSCQLEAIHVSGPDGLIDELPGQGPLAAILSCLNQLTNHQTVLFVPVDMPLLTAGICNALLQDESNGLVSRFQHQMFPLKVVNSEATRIQLAEYVSNERRSIKGWLATTDCIEIDNPWPSALFINTNTPEQWQQLAQWVKDKQL